MLPILERLLHRPTLHRISRVLILVPTRELAIQVSLFSYNAASMHGACYFSGYKNNVHVHCSTHVVHLHTF